MSLRPYLVVSAPSAGVSNIRKAKNVPLLFERVREMRSIDRGPLPPSVYLGRQNVIHMINGPGLPPPFLRTASDQKLDGGRPGTRL